MKRCKNSVFAATVAAMLMIAMVGCEYKELPVQDSSSKVVSLNESGGNEFVAEMDDMSKSNELEPDYTIEWSQNPQYSYDSVRWVYSYRRNLIDKSKPSYVGFIAEKSRKFGTVNIEGAITHEIDCMGIGCDMCVIGAIENGFVNGLEDLGHGGIRNTPLIYDKNLGEYFSCSDTDDTWEINDFSWYPDDMLSRFSYGTMISFEEDGRIQYREDKRDDTIGLIDKTGGVVVEPIYLDVIGLADGLSAVKAINNKWGFVDGKGETIIDFVYDDVLSFNEGYAAICENGRWGIIDKTGKKIIPPRFEGATDVVTGKCYLKENSLWGIAIVNSNYNSSDNSIVDSEQIDPKTVIKWADSDFERIARTELQHPQGDVTAGECATVLEILMPISFVEKYHVYSLDDVKYFTKLERLDLYDAGITDITPLAALKNLEYLDLHNNQISDLSPLSELTKLETLWIKGNPIEDLSPVAHVEHIYGKPNTP